MALEEAWLFLKAGAPPPAWTRPENQFDIPEDHSLRGTEWDHGTTIDTNPALDRMGDNVEGEKMREKLHEYLSRGEGKESLKDWLASQMEAMRLDGYELPVGSRTAAGKGVFRSSPYDNLGGPSVLRHPSHYSKDDFIDGMRRRYRTSPRWRRAIEVAPRPPVTGGSSSVFDDDKMTTDEPDTNGVGMPWSLAEEYPTHGDIAFATSRDNVRRYKAGERNLPSIWDVADNWEDPRSQ